MTRHMVAVIDPKPPPAFSRVWQKLFVACCCVCVCVPVCVRVSVTVRVSVGMRVCVFEGAVERERGREWISS